MAPDIDIFAAYDKYTRIRRRMCVFLFTSHSNHTGSKEKEGRIEIKLSYAHIHHYTSFSTPSVRSIPINIFYQDFSGNVVFSI